VITELSVIIPVYNEAAAILETVDEVGKAPPECGLEAFEIVVVDDGSSDGSVELVADLALVTFLWLLLSFTLYAPVSRC
jgi:glycosyltransferase involved in cell wall biosynthesis